MVSGGPKEPNPPAPQEETAETQIVLFQRDSPKPLDPGKSPTFSFLSSLQLSFVPRPLHVLFPLMNPEFFQVSDMTLSELELSLCVFHPSLIAVARTNLI